MLRALYRCALRLHPAGFRERFGDEMMAIFDQAHRQGAALPLLLDGFTSLTRQWILRSELWNEIPAAAGQPALDGAPSFCSLDPFRPRAATVIPGLVLSLAVFFLTVVGIKYSGSHLLHIRIPEVPFEAQFEARVEEFQRTSSNSVRSEYSGTPPQLSPTDQFSPPDAALAPLASQQVPEAHQQFASAGSNAPVRSATNHSPRSPEQAEARLHQIPLASVGANPEVADGRQLFNSEVAASAFQETPLDAATRQRIIRGAIVNLDKYYVDPDAAQRIRRSLLEHERNGDDKTTTDGAAFAQVLTTQMRDVSHDQYLAMVYDAAEAPDTPAVPSPDDVARYRAEMQRLNCRFEKVEILAHNIGYLKLNAFPDASICGPTAKAAMAKLNHADAIIFDLRDNPGGYANMVALLATYLFDHPTHLNDFYDRAENSTEESWTLPPIPGNALADKPAFILTSHTTFSAAEGFSYDLKILKRATLVGETTSGRGHMGAPHRIDDHFTIRIPGVRVTNPISGTNWEGTGVEPDVKVKAGDALKTAIRLVDARLQK